MRTKRGAAVLLSLCLLIGLFAPARAMAQGEFSPVVLSLSSNLSSADRLEGYYRDQVFYVDVDDACGLAGMTIWSQSENLVEISEGANEEDALRRMSMTALENARSILLALERRHQAVFSASLTLKQIGRAHV